METTQPDLTVVVVSYSGWRYLDACLSSLLAETQQQPMTVIVVDNNSPDGVADLVSSHHAWVTLIRNRSNLGFGKAANIGLRMSDTPFVLLLNPDTIVPPGSLRSCIDGIREHPEVGVLGCRLVKEDGTLDHACKRSAPKPLSALIYMTRAGQLLTNKKRAPGYMASHLGEHEIGVVDAVNGAFMLVRRAALADVGLLDEHFWMYGEDLDWCLRFREAGWSVLYWPGATVMHVKGAIAGTPRRWKTNLAFHRAMWIYFRKHEARNYHPLVNWAVWCAIWLKFAVSASRNAVRRTLARSVARPFGRTSAKRPS